jgi:hypothetical protein
VAFYEVYDEEGCLTKTRQFKVAKRSALAFLTMKSGRRVRIQMYADNPVRPSRAILLDPATRTWSRPQPLLPGAATLA